MVSVPPLVPHLQKLIETDYPATRKPKCPAAEMRSRDF